MNPPLTPDPDFEHRLASSLLDVLIRAGLLLVMVLLCYRIFAPFLTLMSWAVILAVMCYPLHRSLAARMGGRQGWAASTLVVLGLTLVVAPTAVLTSSLGDSVHGLISGVQHNTLHIPPPRDGVATWPLVGKKLHALWLQAHTDLPALVASLQPKVDELAKAALRFVAGIGVDILKFIASMIIAGILMAYGGAGQRGSEAVFARVAGSARGREFARLSTQTIRAVALGVLGIALIQSLIVGIGLVVAGVPWPGALAAVVLVLGIAQVPAAVVILPVIGYLWWGGQYAHGDAILYTVLLLVGGSVDNVLKPLMLGRGVDAPMPVVLIGALGGMATAGILGMFVGATILALGYQIFMGWVDARPGGQAPGATDAQVAPTQAFD
jgi:predicted PurR-regulated permease PerM